MKTAKLIIDSPFYNSSLIYAAKYYCLDPFVFLEIDNKKIGWLPSTELEKAKKTSNIDIIYNLSDEMINIDKEDKYPSLKSSLIIDYLRELDIKEIVVSEKFSIAEAENLRNFGFKIKPVRNSFYNERISKNKKEIEIIKENSKKNSAVMKEVENILLKSSITNDNILKYDGQLLTSEFIQNYILKSFIDKNLYSDAVIVAVGNQGCFPHEYGKGYIYGNTSIIVDIFPRNRSNYYFTDMTRTFCKGKASDDLKKIYSAVLEAQKIALDKVHARADGKLIHNQVKDFFNNNGFSTGIFNGILQGFFHGTGHGVGLDCHELPYISANGTSLLENSIVTVEPGLYYLDKGAVRIEDIIVVKNDGIENLCKYEKKLELE